MLSKIIFNTPKRVNETYNLSIRACLYNINTHVCSQVQAIRTPYFLDFINKGTNNEDDVVSLGHYANVDDTPYSNMVYVSHGDHFLNGMKDWVVVDALTRQEGTAPNYQDVRAIRNHYEYLSLIWNDFHKLVTGKTANESFRGGMVSAHGDKAYGYGSDWEDAGVPWCRGVLLFLLTYIDSELGEYRKDQSDQFVIDRYEHYLPMIIEAEKKNLIWIKGE